MSANPIVRPEASSSVSTSRVAAIIMVTALVAIVAASGVLIALRDKDSDESSSARGVTSSFVFPWDIPEAIAFPDLPVPSDPIANSLRQVVVVSSVEDIAWANSLPGMDMPGMSTEYLVVNDEVSQGMFHEFQLSLAEPGARPTTIIDLR